MSARIALRPFCNADRHFVTDSFLKSFGRSAYAEGLDGRQIIDLIEPLLITWDVLVAADPDEPEEMLGWLCSKGTNLVAWLYVKPTVRRKGVGRALLSRAGIGPVVSAPFVPTKLFDRPFLAEARARGFDTRFRPFLAMAATPTA